MAALEAFMERLTPGRWAEVRPPDARELKATAILRMDLGEASAKLRTGWPGDDERDLTSSAWAGTIPVRLVAGAPEPSPDLAGGIAPSAAVTALVERLGGNSRD
jgi:hypothetical protein